MRGFLTYTGLFAVAVAMQFFLFDSMRVSIYFSPLPYIAFVVLLPMSMRPFAMLVLGLATGIFVDFFEGTAGAHTAATLFTAYVRRWVMIATLGRETVAEEVAMPSGKLLGGGKFVRYVAFIVMLHCLAYFSLEALTWVNLHLVLVKAAVSGVFTFAAVWACSLLFTVKAYRRSI